MNKTILICMILWALASVFAVAADRGTELYLVTGTPTPISEGHFPSRLYIIAPNNQSLHLVREIVPASLGTNFIYAYPDYKVIVFGSPPLNPTMFSLLDMDNPLIDIRLNLKEKVCEHYSVIEPHLLDTPNDGLVLSLDSVSSSSNQPLLKKLSDQRDIQENPALQKYVVAAGVSGGGNSRKLLFRFARGWWAADDPHN